MKKTYGCAVKGPSIGFLHGQPSGLVRFGVDINRTLGFGAEELVPNVARSRPHLTRRQGFQMLSRFPKPAQFKQNTHVKRLFNNSFDWYQDSNVVSYKFVQMIIQLICSVGGINGVHLQRWAGLNISVHFNHQIHCQIRSIKWIWAQIEHLKRLFNHLFDWY